MTKMNKEEKIERLLQALSLDWERITRLERINQEQKEAFRRRFEFLVREYGEKKKGNGEPVSPREIIKRIAREKWRRLDSLIKNCWGGINYFFFERNWKEWKGEPIKKVAGKNRSHYVFVKFPMISLSAVSINPDIVFIPNNIEEPNSEDVGELAAIILYRGNAGVTNKQSDSINLIRIRGKIDFLQHTRDLVSNIFGVPSRFCKIYSEPKQRGQHLAIGSVMVGAYFQNLVGIFKLEPSKSVIKTIPSDKLGVAFKKGFLKETILCQGTKLGKTITIRAGWGRLLALRISQRYAIELGYYVNAIRPVLKKRNQVILMNGKGNLITGKAQIFCQPGVLIFSKRDGKNIEVGDVLKTRPGDNNFETIVQCKMNHRYGKRDKIFIEDKYHFFLRKRS